MGLKNIDSIIFDLDGTLWDASVTCAKAWNKSLQQTGNEDHAVTESAVRSFSGLRIEIILKQYFAFIPENKHRELLEFYRLNEADLIKRLGGELFPHVKEVLLALSKQYKLFIVSNCLVGYIENFILFNELQNIFSDFESSGNTGLAKSDNIKLIIERNRLHNPVYLGDTQWDQEAASKANIPFIYAGYGFGKTDQVEWKINEFTALPRLLVSA
jgi:phosphoglycolate phosphatase